MKNYINYTKKKIIKVQFNSKKKVFKYENLSWLAGIKILNFLKGISYFFYEVISSPILYLKIFKIRETKKNKEVLIIAGGPSANRLNLKDLENFQKKNDIIFVSYFSLNKKFNKIIPDYQVISDPNTLSLTKNIKISDRKKKLLQIIALKKFIFKNKKIKIFAPIRHVKRILKLTSRDNIFGFCDSDLSYIYSSTLPIFPRGYISCTTYKAISIASWMGYKKQYIIGLDNSYANDLRTSSKNEVFLLERHNYERDILYDYTNCYGDFSDYVYEFARLLNHLRRLTANKMIYNLDHFSYTPGLKKIRTKKFKIN
jgi:hypothetical protein